MDEQNQQTLSPPQPPLPPQNVNPPPAPKHKNWIKWVLIIVFVVLLASITTYFVLKSQSQKPPPPQIVQTTPSPTPDLYAEATRSATSNWKTYTNTEENFSLKYPSDWNLKEDKKEDTVEGNTFISLVGIKSPKRKFFVDGYPLSLYGVSVSTKSKMGETTIGQEVDREIDQKMQKPKSPGIGMDERKKIIVAGRDAERIAFGYDFGEEGVIVFTMNKDKIYAIVFSASFTDARLEKKFSGEFKTLTDQILSTFRFTSP